MICTRDRDNLRYDKSLQVTNTLKILGVHLNVKLKWDNHIESLCKKAAQRLHLLRNIKPFVNLRELHDIYCAV